MLKLKFVLVIVVYDTTNRNKKGEILKFLGIIFDRKGDGYRVGMMEDLNGWVRDKGNNPER